MGSRSVLTAVLLALFTATAQAQFFGDEDNPAGIRVEEGGVYVKQCMALNLTAADFDTSTSGADCNISLSSNVTALGATLEENELPSTTVFVNPACTDTQVVGGAAGGGHECQTDVSASSQCSGTTTYYDGEGNCDTLDGLEDFETATDDSVVVGNGTTFDTKAVPDCDTGALQYDTATNTWSCGLGCTVATVAFTQTSSVTWYYNGDGHHATAREAMKMYTGEALTFSNLRCNMWADVANGGSVTVTLETADSSCDPASDGGYTVCSWAAQLTCAITGTTAVDEYTCSDASSVSLDATSFWQLKIVTVSPYGGGWGACSVKICE